MKHTSVSTIALAVLIGVTGGYLIQLLLVTGGLPMLVPPITLPVTVVVAAIAVVALAWPIRNVVKGTRTGRVDPLFASRVAVLAKASTISGAILLGFSAGLAVFAFTRPLMPPTANAALFVASVVGSVLLLAAGLIAERFCTLPPDDPDRVEGAAHG